MGGVIQVSFRLVCLQPVWKHVEVFTIPTGVCPPLSGIEVHIVHKVLDASGENVIQGCLPIYESDNLGATHYYVKTHAEVVVIWGKKLLVRVRHLVDISDCSFLVGYHILPAVEVQADVGYLILTSPSANY